MKRSLERRSTVDRHTANTKTCHIRLPTYNYKCILFSSRAICMGFLVDKTALEPVLLQVPWFSPLDF